MTDFRESQRLKSDVDALKLKAGSPIWYAHTGLSLANDASLTATMSKMVWGGTLGVNNGLIIEQAISYLNNSGLNRTFTVTLTYGATTLITDATVYGTGANNRLLVYRFCFFNIGASNTQVATAVKTHGPAAFSAVTATQSGEGTAAEDSTTDLTLAIKWKHSAAAATVTADERLTVAHFIGAVS